MKNENSIDLPMEIWQKIFRFLDKKCRKNATLTCRKWFKIIRHDTIQSGMDLFISGQNTLKRSSTNYTPRLGFIHRLNWQCYLAGSAKTAPRILIFFQLPRVPIIHLSLFPLSIECPNLLDRIKSSNAVCNKIHNSTSSFCIYSNFYYLLPSFSTFHF